MNAHRILGLGDNTVDTYVSSNVQYPGGNAVNVAALSRRLGADSAYLGCVGDDAGGDLLQRALRAEGVDVSHLRVRHGGNARAFVSHEDGDRRFLGSDPGVRAQYCLTDADYDYIAGFDLVHTSVYSDLARELPRLVDSARRLSFDFSNRWDETLLRATLAHVDLAFLSAADLDDDACLRLLRQCISMGAGQAVATRGSRGAMGTDGVHFHSEPVRPCEVVDTLGAGDGFISAFLMAHLDGKPLPAGLRAGAEFAAGVCGWHGGFGHGEPWNGEAAQFPGPAR
ncbi:MAG: PfkB family carbohydrate kinase [Pseudoxanthomonas sp.]